MSLKCRRAGLIRVLEKLHTLTVESDHGKVLAKAARRYLAPLGFWRKGRSRVWLADRGFWLSTVEFQPSGFSKGSYLNVATHWSWSAMPDIFSFDFSIERDRTWDAFDDDADFERLAERLATKAASESQQLQTKFSSFSTTASVLVADVALKLEGHVGWPTFNAAMAAGMSGDMTTASSLFDATRVSLCAWKPELETLLAPYSEALKDKRKFQIFIAHLIDEQRSAYGLEPWKVEKA